MKLIEENKKLFKEACRDLEYNEETGQYDNTTHERYFHYKQQLKDLGVSEEEIEDLEETEV